MGQINSQLVSGCDSMVVVVILPPRKHVNGFIYKGSSSVTTPDISNEFKWYFNQF